MPAHDKFHAAVRNGLIKGQWTITHDPLVVQFDDIKFQVDLGAERLIAAEKSGARIAVEIKSFLGASTVSEFHTALGQFLNYRLVLDTEDPDRVLYLAVPVDTYEDFFTGSFAQAVIERHDLFIIVFDPQREVIEQWIPVP